MNGQALLDKVTLGEELSGAEIAFLLEAIAEDRLHPVQVGAFLGAMRARGESVRELAGAARMLRQKAVRIDCGCARVVDIVGTGGDCSGSFNISTTASFIAAGAGVTVAKHGNRGVSSKSGAADVLAAAGFNLDAEAPLMEYAIQTLGIGFLFAAKLHPVMGKVAPLRKALGIRTIFNMLGPLINPAGAKYQILGVYDPSLVETFARVLAELGVNRALVVHGLDGIDEISVSAPTRVAELRDGSIKLNEIHPDFLLGATYAHEEIKGGTPEENAVILRDILSGRERGAKREIAVVNAGAAIYVTGGADTLKEGCRAAEDAVDSGRALEKLEQLIEVSHS